MIWAGYHNFFLYEGSVDVSLVENMWTYNDYGDFADSCINALYGIRQSVPEDHSIISYIDRSISVFEQYKMNVPPFMPEGTLEMMPDIKEEESIDQYSDDDQYPIDGNYFL